MSELVDSSVLLENLDVAIIVVDQDVVIQAVNISAETLFEQSRRYLIGRQLEDLVSMPAVHKCIQECLQNNAQYTLRELAIELPGKTMLVDMTLSSVGNQHGLQSKVLMEINSINRISRFMKEQNQLERQQSFRLMMRSLAHEIKNPLGGIRGAAQLLDREISDPGKRELTEILIKEADRLTRLVDRVMGSREQLRLRPLNIHEVLEHVVHLVCVKSPVRLTINRSYDPALPEINADKEQLIQAVLNVVGNAVEAQQGSEEPEIGLRTQFERFITINQKMHRQVLKIQIWDNGQGVPEDMLDILFDPLITGRPEGTGLGLSITQEIVQRHKGLVQLEDLDGKTCFTIYLPYAADNASDGTVSANENDGDQVVAK